MADEFLIKNVEIPNLRIKRPHKKVRSGCATCKRARVKCDERRPRCTRCHRKKIECSYLDRPSASLSPPNTCAEATHGKSKYVGSESSRDFMGKNSLCSADSQDLGGIPDTELAKHYLTHTLQTFVAGGMGEDHAYMWQTFIPAVAPNCSVVREGMLTLAAICLHHESASDVLDEHDFKYLEAAEAHGKIFVKESRQKMQDFQARWSTQDPDSVLACSRLLSLLGFAFFRTHRQNGTRLADPAAWTWLHLLRGVRTTYLTVFEAGRPIDEMFMKDMTAQLCCHRLSPLNGIGCQNPYFRYVRRSQRGSLDALRSTLHRDWSFLGDRKTDDLGAAIDLLDRVTEKVCSQQSQSLFRTICTWPADISGGFVNMLVGGSPPALTIYAHWLMLVVLVEDLWWVDDMGRAGIRDIIAMCSDADRSVHSLLIRPQQMLDVNSESADTVK